MTNHGNLEKFFPEQKIFFITNICIFPWFFWGFQEIISESETNVGGLRTEEKTDRRLLNLLYFLPRRTVTQMNGYLPSLIFYLLRTLT